jgi:aspartokinase/homoserine dehydrogenase 1
VRRIEAVLSGTLSFIFNNFDGTKSFSELVREAKAKGYTEPDPRDDLNAMDAARKALILARECGLSLEFEAVEIEPILPAACFDAPDVESFFAELKKADPVFEQRRSSAANEGKALRYVAVIEEGAASLRLRAEADGDALFAGFPRVFSAAVSHSQSVLRLPPGAVLLAENDFEPHHAFRVGACARSWCP